jgi:polyphosphate kinase
VQGVSDNIQVRSVVGRFLEHTRVYYFENAGKPLVYCASADWIERNFFGRVEVGFPIEGKKLRERVIKDLHTYLQDNTQAWVLKSDGSYERLVPGEAPPVAAQSALLAELAKTGSAGVS